GHRRPLRHRLDRRRGRNGRARDWGLPWYARLRKRRFGGTGTVGRAARLLRRLAGHPRAGAGAERWRLGVRGGGGVGAADRGAERMKLSVTGGGAGVVADFGAHVTRIPLRLRKGQPPPFRPEDVILQNGDVVYIPSRDADVFYTGGLLFTGQYALPRDYDLGVV